MAVLCRGTGWSNLVQWQPPDGSRLESGFVLRNHRTEDLDVLIILFLIGLIHAGKKDVTTPGVVTNGNLRARGS